MPTQVFKVKPEEIHRFHELLLEEKSIETLPTTNPYEVFRVKHRDCLLIGYTTGKIVANRESAKPLVLRILQALKRGKLDFDIIIGSDEAGKGEWLGPMTIATVSLSQKETIRLQSEGIMDSKKIQSPNRIDYIIDLSKKIKGESLAFHSVTISPTRFNELLKEIKNEGKSLNDMLAWGHAKAIDEVYRKVRNEKKLIKIVIDEFDRLKTESRLKRVLSLKDVVFVQKPRAEEEIAVAAASILARAERELWIDRKSKNLGFDLRAISPMKALNMRGASEFAKVSYLSKHVNL